jgi:tetratricopeptide (TPR) repeat protein
MTSLNWIAAAALAATLATTAPARAQVQHTGDICASNAEPEKVIEDCTYELKQDFLYANAAIAYNNRAIAYMRLRKYDLAIRDLTLAIKAAPDWTLPLINRAHAYRANGQPDLAQADLIALTKRGAFRAEEHLAKGRAYAELERYPEAIAEYSVGIGQKPRERGILIGLLRSRAEAYRRTGQDDLASKDDATLKALQPAG